TLWSVSRMPMPWMASSRMLRRMSSVVLGSTAANGSSSRVRSGSPGQERGGLRPGLSPPQPPAGRWPWSRRGSEPGHHAVGPVPPLAVGELPAEAAAAREGLEDGEQVLLDGELAEDALFLGQVAHAQAGPAVHGQPGDVLTVEDDLAVVRGDLAGGHAEAGGLAGPVGAEQADHLARVDLVGHAVHGPPLAVNLDQPAGLEQRHWAPPEKPTP